jgi:hypothetical protein
MKKTKLETTERPSRAPAITLIAGSAAGVLFWCAMLFFALVLGGSPGPGYERTTPLSYALVIGLGLAGAIVGLVAGVKSVRGKSVLAAAIAAVVLGAVGSVPFFLLELPEVGVIALALGILPATVSLIFGKR